MELAPVLLFTYKRLDTLKSTISALRSNFLAKDTELYVFSDGPKNVADENTIQAVRNFLKTIDGFKKITIYESYNNKGLANSIIDGVSSLIDKYEKVIVLEDDIRTVPNFLSYMNFSLDYYRDSINVFSISGYSFNLGYPNNYKFDSYFLNRGWSWGWATWKDRWVDVDWNVSDYNSFITNKQAQKQFSKGGSDLNSMLAKQMNGDLDSWAIRWFYHQFKVNGLTLYPVFSKVYNEGFDKDATHTTGAINRYVPSLDISDNINFKLPPDTIINKYFQDKFIFKMSIFSRIISKIQGLLKI